MNSTRSTLFLLAGSNRTDAMTAEKLLDEAQMFNAFVDEQCQR